MDQSTQIPIVETGTFTRLIPFFRRLIFIRLQVKTENFKLIQTESNSFVSSLNLKQSLLVKLQHFA